MDITVTTEPAAFGTTRVAYLDETGREVVGGNVPASQHDAALQVLAALPAGGSLIYRQAKARSIGARSYWHLQHAATDWTGTVKADRIADLLDEATRAAYLIAEHCERQIAREAERIVADAKADLVTVDAELATPRQVEYLITLLLRRIATGDEGGFHAVRPGLIVGDAVDRRAVARLSKVEASMLISSLSGTY